MEYLPLLLPSQLADKVSAFAKHHSTTTYHLLLAAFALTISRACRQGDIVISGSLSKRALPLRFQLGSISSVGQLLALSQQVLGAALAHGDMPFQRLMEELDLPQTTAYMPFFQAAITTVEAGWFTQAPFVGTNLASSSASQGGMDAFLAGDIGVSKLDLMLVMAEDADRDAFAINLQYNTDIFAEATVRPFQQSMIQTLLALAALVNPDECPLNHLLGEYL